MKGLVWRIGNGEKVRIWGDKWVPIPSSYKIHSSSDHAAMDVKVSLLSDKDIGQWDQTVIEDLFDEEKVKAIKTIPLS
jgi:hypothetical protein